jgi:LPXTG-motif cell wall-anchored protein
MRGSTVLFLAGAAAIVSGTVAPAFSAEDPARVTPAPAAESASDPAPAVEAPVEAVEADEASADEPEGGLERPSLEPAIEERSGDREGDRDAKAKERGSVDSKQPLANASVTMKNIAFNPKTLTIAPGDRVTWTNRDTAQHNAVEQDEEFETRLLDKGESASVTIDGAGTYNYICTVHPNMKGKLIAQSGGGSSSGSGGSSSSSGSTGSTGSSTGSSSGSSFPGSSASSGSSGSSGSLPNTGQEQLPLLILGAGLIVLGLLARAFHEYWIWR